MPPVRQLTKKVCLLGDFAVGKTSLVRRYVEGRFSERYLSTIGVKVDRKVLTVPASDGEVMLTLMIWDLAGGPDLGAWVPNYYRGAAGVITVCDLTRPETLASIDFYVQALRELSPAAELVVAANKADLMEQRSVSDAEMAAVSDEYGAPFFLTSAKTGERVEEMFYQLGLLLVGS